MPESEMFKMAMQGGMLGLWMVFMWWVLFSGVPILQGMVTATNASHQTTILSLAESHRENIDSLNATHKEAVTVLSVAQKETANALAKECREERREILEIVYKKLNLPANSA